MSTCVKNIYLTEELSSYIFNSFSHINKIVFTNTFDKSFSSKYTICQKSLDDHILDLREFNDIEHYLSHLGKKTRQHLRNYKRRFNTLCENAENVFESKVLIPHKMTEEFENACADIYRLNNDRCLSKGFSSGIDRRYVNLCAAGEGGIIYYRFNHSMIAGTMFSIYNNKLYLYIVAHDNMYSDYNVGNLVLLDTIEYAITHGISEFHFLWGECEYKKRFGAKKYDLFDIVVYKSGLRYSIDRIALGLIEIKRRIKKVIISFMHKIGMVKFVKCIILKTMGESIINKIGRWLYKD